MLVSSHFGYSDSHQSSGASERRKRPGALPSYEFRDIVPHLRLREHPYVPSVGFPLSSTSHLLILLLPGAGIFRPSVQARNVAKPRRIAENGLLKGLNLPRAWKVTVTQPQYSDSGLERGCDG